MRQEGLWLPLFSQLERKIIAQTKPGVRPQYLGTQLESYAYVREWEASEWVSFANPLRNAPEGELKDCRVSVIAKVVCISISKHNAVGLDAVMLGIEG